MLFLVSVSAILLVLNVELISCLAGTSSISFSLKIEREGKKSEGDVVDDVDYNSN